MMKAEEVSSHAERRVVTGMIVSEAVLGRVASRWESKRGPFESRWANLVGGWCVDYLARYGRAPGRDIEAIFRSHAAEGGDDGTQDLVGRFLASLSREYEDAATFNADHVLDQAGDHFNAVRIRRAIEALQGDLQRGEVGKAVARWDAFRPVEMGATGWVDPMADDEAWRAALEDGGRSIVEFPGGLGEFFGDTLERDGLVAVMASEKRGKSHWLLEVAFTAFEQGLKVAVFEVGDMSQNQLMRRLIARVCKRPILPRRYAVPVLLELCGNELVFQSREYQSLEPLDPARAMERRARYLSGLETRGQWHMSFHANSSVSVPGLRSVLARWAREGFVPDVCVVDYADILAPVDAKMTSRDQINETWKALRRMSQELHCLVVTATQADAASYDTPLLTRKNFSEDKRKYGHVTGMFGLNQTSGEKPLGQYRVNWLMRREEDFSEKRVCHVAGCLTLARPAMLSAYRGE